MTTTLALVPSVKTPKKILLFHLNFSNPEVLFFYWLICFLQLAGELFTLRCFNFNFQPERIQSVMGPHCSGRPFQGRGQ